MSANPTARGLRRLFADPPALRIPRKPWAFLPELDGLRAVSVMLVLVSHLGFGLGHLVPGGLGVTVFFFISGFIITRLLLGELNETRAISFPNFYLRRFLRLGPALVVYLVVSLSFMAAIGWRFDLAEPLAVLLYYANYYHIYVGFKSAGDVLSPLGVLWSLSVEEHFYMAFPLLLLVMARRRTQLLWILAGTLVLALAWRAWLAFGIGVDRLPMDRMFKATDTRFDSIIWGCVAALLMERYGKAFVLACARPAVVTLALVLLLASLVLRDPGFRESLRYSMQGFAIVVLGITLVFTDRLAPLSALLRSPAALYVGRISYSLYMYHWLAVGMAARFLPGRPAWVVIPATLAASFAMSIASYHFVEVPAQALRRRFQAHPN